LVVDDDCVDVMCARRALHELGVTNEVVCAANGEEALAYLNGRENEMPCVILLDLNMPRMDGLEFLQVVKADGRFQRIPIVVVTTSGEQQDQTRSLELGAAAYVVKSSDYAEFRRDMTTIERYVAPSRAAERSEPVPS
jgi:CheY-like chemotaxis protein